MFYKTLEDALFFQSTTFDSNILNTTENGVLVDRSQFRYTTLRNGGDGYIRGVEVAYNQFAESLVERLAAPQWLGGFGLRLSATISESEINIPEIVLPGNIIRSPARKSGLPGASDLVYNAGLVYEKYDLSLRLAYQFRTKWLQEVGSYTTVNNVIVPDGNGDIYWNDSDSLNFSARYQINETFEITFDAVNLLDSPGRRFADSEAFPIEYETFGKRLLAGVKFKF